jgi:hypothetical protein
LPRSFVHHHHHPCRGLDCPSFDVVETRGSLQLRRYSSGCFIVTRVEADNLLQAQVIATKVSRSALDDMFAVYVVYGLTGATGIRDVLGAPSR